MRGVTISLESTPIGISMFGALKLEISDFYYWDPSCDAVMGENT